MHDDHAHEPAAEIDFLGHFRTEGARISEIARSNDLATTVPSCPEWTLGQLVGHCARIWAFAKASIEAGERVTLDDPTDNIAEAHETAHAALVEHLSTNSPDTPCWTFAGDATLEFWLRRMGQEAALHRWDAENAVSDTPAPIDAALAVDGIDELFDLFVIPRDPLAYAGEPATVHLHATDAHGEWIISRNRDGIEVERAHAKGDVAARGPASDLLLMMWNRIDVAELEVFGDETLLAEWQERVRI